MRSRRYGDDVLAAGSRRPRPGQRSVPQVEAEPGLVVEDFEGKFCGAVVAFEKDAVTLEDRHGNRRAFPLPGAFLFEGERVTLVRRAGTGRAASPATEKTASGSIAAPQQRAKVARASRIYVEGRHDAELVEKIWGDDLRDVGVVVEYLEGVDDLPAIAKDFQPGPGRRLGVLVDHLVDGSKESRIAAAAGRDPHVLVVGHPYIDVWAAVKPARLGLARVAGRTAGRAMEGRRAAPDRLAREHPAGRRRRLAADPAGGDQLRRPRAGTARPGRGAHRLRHRAGAAAVTSGRGSRRPRAAALRGQHEPAVRESGRVG